MGLEGGVGGGVAGGGGGWGPCRSHRQAGPSTAKGLGGGSHRAGGGRGVASQNFAWGRVGLGGRRPDPGLFQTLLGRKPRRTKLQEGASSPDQPWVKGFGTIYAAGLTSLEKSLAHTPDVQRHRT